MEENKKLDTPEIQEVKDDLGKFKALAALSNQEGGKILLEAQKSAITDSIELIMSLFRGEEMLLRCAVAKLIANLDLYRVLKRAEQNAKLTEEELSRLLELDNRQY